MNDSEPRPHPALSASMLLCLAVGIASLVYGHVDAAARGLHPWENYLTEYMKAAPHWPWLVVACFAFALLLMLLAVALLWRSRPSLGAVLGCLLLAASSMGMFFIAYAPMRRMEQPPAPSHQWWTPTWWFTSHTARTPYEDGMADAYEDVHYRATRLVVTCGVLAMLCLSLGMRRETKGSMFSTLTLVCGVGVGLLFFAADQSTVLHGLWQRLGFGLLVVWLVASWWRTSMLPHQS